MSFSSKGISVVIPALNEEHGLKNTLESIIAVFENPQNSLTHYEIIIVDDGSTDATSSIATAYPQVKVVRHPISAGYGRSLKDGIAEARYETIVITDADATYPVEKIPDLYSKYSQGFDMVVAARTGANYRQSFFKAILRRMLRWVTECITGKKILDINSGFRIFSKSEIQALYFHLCDTFSFTTSLTLAYMLRGKFVAYIPVPYYAREGKTKVKLFRDSIYTIIYILKQVLYFDPLKIFLLFSLIWILFGICILIFSLIFGFTFGYIITTISILASFIMLGFGLLAEQLRHLMHK